MDKGPEPILITCRDHLVKTSKKTYDIYECNRCERRFTTKNRSVESLAKELDKSCII
jgi:hypothetical protein